METHTLVVGQNITPQGYHATWAMNCNIDPDTGVMHGGTHPQIRQGRHWTPDEVAWLRANNAGKSMNEIVEGFARQFPPRRRTSIQRKLYQLTNQWPSKSNTTALHSWSNQEHQWLDKYGPTMTTRELHRAFCDRFAFKPGMASFRAQLYKRSIRTKRAHGKRGNGRRTKRLRV